MGSARTALLAIACAALASPALPVSAPSAVLRGRIVDQDGAGVAGATIRLLQSRRDFDIQDWKLVDRLTDSRVARSDAHGFFEATLSPDPGYRHFWLRFYDADRFDVVRYDLPDDVDITTRMRRGRPITLTVVLEDHSRWRNVRAWIDRLGAGSDRGRLVRRLGIPDRREQSSGVESFWYDREGMVYRFREGRFVGEEQFAAGGGSLDRPSE